MAKNALRLKAKEEDSAMMTESGWSTSFGEYDSARINGIEDVMGAEADKNITSVPSPLAQMHVYETAFKFVNENRKNTLSKETVYHKLVSRCLDVWEVLFTYQQHEGLDFKVWDKKQSITNLLASADSGHNLLGRTLALYLNNSSNPKIQAINNIYLLTYKGRVFAGSSPMTGFFVSPDVTSMGIPWKTNQNVEFFTKDRNVPFSKRDKDFQTFMVKLMESHKGIIVNYFKVLFDYIAYEKQVSQYANDLIGINNGVYNATNFNADFTTPIKNSQDFSMIIQYGNLRFPMPQNTVSVDESCQFIIQPTKPIAGRSISEYPLVFQKRNNVGIYLKGEEFLQNYNDIPLDTVDENGNEIPIKDRRLPIYDIKHPFITAGDFLEEYLVQTDYPINDDKFRVGNLEGFDEENPFRYLLPIKPAYFNYFTEQDLENQLKITRLDSYGTIEVELSIPVSGGGFTSRRTIELKRKYTQSNEENIILTKTQIRLNNKGVGQIIDSRFGLSLFPFVRSSDPQYNDYYKVGLKSMQYGMESKFYKIDRESSTPVSNSFTVLGSKEVVWNKEEDLASQYYLLNTDFDFIQLDVDHPVNPPISGLIIPKWEIKPLGSVSFDFAIDFGTSNSYVAYRVSNGNSLSFDITEKDMQLVRLDKPKQSVPGKTRSITEKYENTILFGGSYTTNRQTALQRQQEIPSVMGIEEDGYNMPFQTAIATSKDALSATNINTANANIPFVLGKYMHNEEITAIYTNIKWSNPDVGSPEEARMDAFFRELLYMIRTKILLNNGDPSKTKFIWFKPLSMSGGQIMSFNRLWANAVNKILHSQKVECITESEAPYYLLSSDGLINSGTHPALSIDIGGGTTDVLVFDQNTPKYSMSSLMASRVMFGEYNAISSRKNNPIVKYYHSTIEEKIRELITDSQDTKLQEEAKQMKKLHEWYFDKNSTTRSEDVIGFYFSRPKLGFKELLAHPSSPFKISFLFYFAALHYNCAKYLKTLGLKAPRDISMSGNGSKMMYIIDPAPSSSSSYLAKFITLIYEKVMGEDISYTIKIHTTDKPKEITAKGGLYKDDIISNRRAKGENIQDADKKVFAGEKLYRKDGSLVPEDEVITYGELKDDYKFKMEGSNYYDLVDMFTGYLNQEISYKDNFLIDCDLDEVKNILKDPAYVEIDFETALQKRLDMSNDTDKLTETLFFYPVMGAIDRLSKHMAEKSINRKS